MSLFTQVLSAYSDAWSRRRVFVPVHVAVRAIAAGAAAPVLGGLVNLAVSLSDKPALTDQDIAFFLLSPLGFAAALIVASIFLAAEVTGFSAMAAALVHEQPRALPTARAALAAVARRFPALAIFTGLFLLRILAISLPFVAVAGGLALYWLSDYDINYYLTFHPPEFIRTVVVAGLILAVLAYVLLLRLAAWAVALHLVLFDDMAPAQSFAASAARMQGRGWRLKAELALWLLVRLALAAALALVAGLAMGLMPVQPGSGLARVLLFGLLIMALWVIASAVLAAVALGALAVLLDHCYGGARRPPPEEGQGRVMRRRSWLLAGLAVLAGVGIWLGSTALDAVQPRDDVEIIAHRGAAGARPENTMASIREALEQGADWVEIDVQETADGQIAVVHDSDLMKLAGVPLQIHASSFDELHQQDIGSWFDPQYADERVPLLSEVLETVRGRAGLLIEFKHYGFAVALEQRVIDEVEAAGMMADGQTAFMSLKIGSVEKAKELRPDWRGGILAASAVGNVAGLPGDFAAVRSAIATPALISSVHGAGKELYVWTVNDPLEMSKMISKGVDGLITDEPGLARRVLEVRAQLSTPERLLLWLVEEMGLNMTPAEYRDDSP